MLPAQTGLLLLADGEAGIVLTVTLVVPAAPTHPKTVAVTEYVPPFTVAIFVIVEFWEEEEYVFGPLQLYVAPEIVLAVKVNVVPTQTGLLLPAVGAAGIGFTVTLVVPAEPVQPDVVAVTE